MASSGRKLEIEALRPLQVGGRELMTGDRSKVTWAKALSLIEAGNAFPVVERDHRPALDAERRGLAAAYRLYVRKHPSVREWHDGRAAQWSCHLYVGHAKRKVSKRMPGRRDGESVEDWIKRGMRRYTRRVAEHDFVGLFLNGDLELRGLAENDMASGEAIVPRRLLDADVVLHVTETGEGQLRLTESKGPHLTDRLYSALKVRAAKPPALTPAKREGLTMQAEQWLTEQVNAFPDENPFGSREAAEAEVARQFPIGKDSARVVYEKIVYKKFGENEGWRRRRGRPKKSGGGTQS